MTIINIERDIHGLFIYEVANMKHIHMKQVLLFFIFCILLFLLFLSSKYNYLLFHSIVELFSICIAFSVFSITLSSHRYLKNNYFLIVGIAYLFIGLIDLFHTLSYKGMPIFTDYDYYANQLWIGARYLESITLLSGLFFLRMKKQLNIYVLMVVYTVLTTLILLSVFIWKIFPICFSDEVGLTPFKKISEYIIIVILLICLLMLHNVKKTFEPKIYYLIVASIICTIISEFSFTTYVSNYGFMSAFGHYFKIFSFYFVYMIILKIGIQEPYNVVFREMKLSEVALSLKNEQLKDIAIRDSLTNLYNHGYIYEFLSKEEKRFIRSREPFSIIMIDIDHFKQMNDTHGHVQGDLLLRELAVLLKGHLRSSDIIGRYGGEEFLAVLVNSDLNTGFYVAEKIRKTVENYIFSNGLTITISLGVSEYQETSISDLIDRADKKMYEAKRLGRNRTVC